MWVSLAWDESSLEDVVAAELVGAFMMLAYVGVAIMK